MKERYEAEAVADIDGNPTQGSVTVLYTLAKKVLFSPRGPS
jgi:hypothetical protein